VVGELGPVDALWRILRGLPLNWAFVNVRTLAFRLVPDLTPAAIPPDSRHAHWWRRLASGKGPGALDQVLISTRGDRVSERAAGARPPAHCSAPEVSRSSDRLIGVVRAAVGFRPGRGGRVRAFISAAARLKERGACLGREGYHAGLAVKASRDARLRPEGRPWPWTDCAAA
jgi:hypothetical protein